MGLKEKLPIVQPTPVACDCDRCRNLCRTDETFPGVPTLREAIQLVAQGKSDDLELDYWYLGNRSIWYLRPAPRNNRGSTQPGWFSGRTGVCSLWDDERRCTVHGTGAKPAECRAAGCAANYVYTEEGHKEFMRWKEAAIIRSWDSARGEALTEAWRQKQYMKRGDA